jgi:hypothetical protein
MHYIRILSSTFAGCYRDYQNGVFIPSHTAQIVHTSSVTKEISGEIYENNEPDSEMPTD